MLSYRRIAACLVLMETLYISTGDNTSPFASDGFSPSDETPGRSPFDAQKSSANTNDLRGKILRIHIEPDGTYTIPEGNLFAKGEPNTTAGDLCDGMSQSLQDIN